MRKCKVATEINQLVANGDSQRANTPKIIFKVFIHIELILRTSVAIVKFHPLSFTLRKHTSQ